ncbi:MAG: pilus assembly protein [Actinobacteria bacterium]|nr:pilus assembly protein [Actinomycetota bacterium]
MHVIRGPRRRRASQAHTRDRGSAVVEFVLVAPLVLFLFAAIAQISFVSYVRSTLIACAAEGARAGALADADSTTAKRRTRVALGDSVVSGLVRSIDVSPERKNGIDTVAVTVTAKLPLVGLLGPTKLRVTGHSLAEDY